MERNHLLHELHVLHQTNQVVGEELDSGHGSHAAGIQRGGMHVPAFHQAEHFARHAAHLQRFAIEGAGERIQRRHDVGDGAETVQIGMIGGGFLRFGPDAGVGFLHHLLAEVDAHQVVLEDVVIEHVLGGLAQVDDPLAQRRRLHSERHILGIIGARGVIIAANPANAAGDEVGVARIFPFHENAVAAEDGRGAVTLGHLAIFKVDLSENAETPDNASDGIPVHFDQVSSWERSVAWIDRLIVVISISLIRPRMIPGGEFGSAMPPLGFLVDRVIGE